MCLKSSRNPHAEHFVKRIPGNHRKCVHFLLSRLMMWNADQDKGSLALLPFPNSSKGKINFTGSLYFHGGGCVLYRDYTETTSYDTLVHGKCKVECMF